MFQEVLAFDRLMPFQVVWRSIGEGNGELAETAWLGVRFLTSKATRFMFASLFRRAKGKIIMTIRLLCLSRSAVSTFITRAKLRPPFSASVSLFLSSLPKIVVQPPG